MTLAYCRGCFEKQLEINRLKEEIERLKAKVRYQERTAKEGVFGSSTPSAKVPLKPNALEERQARRGGGKAGHEGHGRGRVEAAEADRVERVAVPDCCPDCGRTMESEGTDTRTVVEMEPVRVRRVLYRLERKRCPHCGRRVEARAPGVLPKALYGNALLTHVAVQHYVRGVTLGQLGDQLEIGNGSLVEAMHQLARRLKPVSERLVQAYREAPVKHADETSWRTDGRNGYAWLFATPDLSLFRLRKTRAAAVVEEILGPDPLPGTLVVDRYNGYNRAPCAIQYCYAHLLRLVTDLEKDFPGHPEVKAFVERLAPLLAKAMELRTMGLSRRRFRAQAAALKAEIVAVVHRPARHPAIQNVQDIFRQNAERLYRWAEDPTIPADNNLAERDLRPLVIARKVSFGSQSPAGASTRETLMSVLRTLQKRTQDVAAALKSALDKLVEDPALDLSSALFPPKRP